VARIDIDTSRDAYGIVLSRQYALMKAYIHTQQSGNSNDYIEMYEIFNPEIPGLEPPNPVILGLRKMPRDPGIGIPTYRQVKMDGICTEHLGFSI
jgi:hypothetical protein